MILSNRRTLLQDIEHSKKNGFLEEFLFINGKIMSRHSKEVFESEDLIVCEYMIHEGLSDPSDQSILFLIETKNKGIKGLISGAYGTYADHELLEFFLSIQNRA